MSDKRLTKEYRYYYANTKQLSESLCNGIATRFLRDVVSHNERFRIHYLKSKPIPLEEAIIGFSRSLKNNHLSRKQNVLAVENYLNANFFVDPYVKTLNKSIEREQHHLKSGLLEKNGSIQAFWIFMNQRKPHDVSVEKLNVMFSKHSIARILYRFKPADLFSSLVNFATILEPLYIFLVDNKFIFNTSESWFYIPGIGGFLFSDKGDYLNIVTYVDEIKLTDNQRLEGTATYDFVKNIDSAFAKSIYDFFSYQSKRQSESICKILTLSTP